MSFYSSLTCVKKYIFHCISKIQIIYLFHLGCFHRFALANTGALNIHGHDFWCTHPSVLLRGEQQSYWKCMSSTSQDNVKLISKWFNDLYFCHQCLKFIFVSQFHKYFIFVLIFNFGHSGGYKVLLYLVFIFIFLITVS